MRRVILSLAACLSLFLVCDVGAGAGSSAGKQDADLSNGHALSLRVLQDWCEANEGKGGMQEQFHLMAGLRRIVGYVVDEENRDLILVGRVEGRLPPLDLDDFVVALRNTWLRYAELRGNTRYYSNPGCSIDPDPQVMQRLQEVGTRMQGAAGDKGALGAWHEICGSPQDVRVLGIPYDTRFARVMVDADYDMKRLVDGSDSLEITGFMSLTDMTLREARNQIMGGGNIALPAYSMNRFWFYPGENRYLTAKGVVVIDECQVTLLTEEQFLSKTGSMGGTGSPSPPAAAFAQSLTSRYAEVAKLRPIYGELENLFRFVALVKIMKWKNVLKEADLGLDYFLDRYSHANVTVPQELPGRSNVNGFSHRVDSPDGYVQYEISLPSCGGVDIAIDVGPESFSPDTTGTLADLRAAVLSARPSPDALFWAFGE